MIRLAEGLAALEGGGREDGGAPLRGFQQRGPGGCSAARRLRRALDEMGAGSRHVKIITRIHFAPPQKPSFLMIRL